jgi:hypothetical protein
MYCDVMLDEPAPLTPEMAINDFGKQKQTVSLDGVEDASTTSPGNDHLVPTSKTSPVIMMKARSDYYGSIYVIPMYEVCMAMSGLDGWSFLSNQHGDI